MGPGMSDDESMFFPAQRRVVEVVRSKGPEVAPMDVEVELQMPGGGLHPSCGTKQPCPGRAGQFMKLPSDSHRASMTAHVTVCGHEGCRSVWSGPWGSFIGGSRGATHFDLTECPVGRQLNEATGWNYEDPGS